MNYLYDAAGQRVGKQQADTLEDYVYDPEGHIISTHDGSANLLRTDLYAGSRHVASWAPTNPTYWDPYPAGLFYNHTDWLGTERVRTTSTGAIAETCTDTPYGMNLTCNSPVGIADTSPMHLTGKQLDPETGNHYFGARYLASGTSLGRWMSPDPKQSSAHATDPQSWNRYGYTNNNPLIFIDPDGKEKQLAVYVEQPVPGTRQIREGLGDYGHSFIGLRDTTTGKEQKFGFYPQNKWDLALDRSASVPGVVKRESSDAGWTVQMSYTISDKQYDQLMRDITGQIQNGAPDYNMETENCTTWVVNEAGTIGIDLPQTPGKDAGGSGLDPGDLGQDLRDKGAQVIPNLNSNGGSSGTSGTLGNGSSGSGSLGGGSSDSSPHNKDPNKPN